MLIIHDIRNDRRKMRRVALDSTIERCREIAAGRATKRAIVAKHGGTVPNCYGYAACTDAVVVVVQGDNTVAWAREIPANKATLSGVLARCVGEKARALLDERYGDEATEKARAYIHAQAAEEFNR